MKLLGLFVFLYLLIPGSGQLVWDGLPFSTRAEFATFVLFVVVVLSSGIRQSSRDLLNRFRWRVLLTPALLILCLVKFFTFVLSPLSAGFGACYRSLYEPLKDSQACEKSFEAPFLQGHGLPQTKISRVDPTVDFGIQMFDWRLPFMNEFHRFPVLWLSRFPFTAAYEARVENDSDTRMFLPIRAIGELEVTVDGNVVTRTTNYAHHFLEVVPLPPGSSTVRVNFRYSDDDISKLPEIEPSARGPYARLKVGALHSDADIISMSRIRLLGTTSNNSALDRLIDFTVIDRYGQTVTLIDLQTGSAQDDSETYGRKPPDLEIEMSAAALADGPLNVFGTRREGSVLLATVQARPGNPFGIDISEVADSGLTITALRTINGNSFDALRPGPLLETSLAVRILLWLLDLSSLMVTIFLACIIALHLRLRALISIGIGIFAWLAVNPLYNSLPSLLGGGRELVVPYALIAFVIVLSRYSIVATPLALLLPVSVVVAAQKVFDHLYFNHPGEGNNWWGKLIYLWRDSDWYVNHGNARAVFVESFFRGGESVFYARTGPRYLIFLGQFLLGENDILIGLISVTAGFLTVFFLASRFAVSSRNQGSVVIAVAIMFLGMILLGDQIITAFGFLVTSEYTTWIGLLGVTAFFIGRTIEHRAWLTTSISATVATLIHFRPNILFVGFALLFLVIAISDREATLGKAHQIAWSLTVFAVILPISLLHNLYYGGRFVPFTENAAQTVAIHKRFSWTTIWTEYGAGGALELIWQQTRIIMYWVKPGDPNLAMFFWGSQALLLFTLIKLAKGRVLKLRHKLIALLPTTYVIPMISYNLSSYFPRHIVVANLLCLCSAMIIWSDSMRQDEDRVPISTVDQT
jgi:hypothetical protein